MLLKNWALMQCHCENARSSVYGRACMAEEKCEEASTRLNRGRMMVLNISYRIR